MTRARRQLTPAQVGPAADGVAADNLARTLTAIRSEFAVPGPFPAEALADLARVLGSPTGPPARFAGDDRQRADDDLERDDDTDVDFVTIDPPGSSDLDQALHIERNGRGYRVRYAIADVAAFVPIDGALDRETRSRGQTLYLPDGRIPLHPPALSEDAASLLPGRNRPAFVWDLRLGPDGEPTEVGLSRSTVRSRAQLDYPGAQRDLDAGRAPDVVGLLAEVGGLRIKAEAARGGASLPKPDQEIYPEGGRYHLRFRPHVPVEEYNAQISLLTGMAAARLMVTGGVGLLRTMPGPGPDAVDVFRRQADALGVGWPAGQPYGRFLQGLSRDDPHHLALMHAATSLFRGAGYTVITASLPTAPDHAALAAPYAHVTAPLRRLADRFALVVCLALTRRRPVPDWALAALPALPELMAASDRLAAALDRACTDAVEAAVLAPLIGCDLPAMVIENRGAKGLLVQINDPAVVARCDGSAQVGQRIRARVREADPTSRRVRFDMVGDER